MKEASVERGRTDSGGVVVIEWVLPFPKLGNPGREAGAVRWRRGFSLATM